MCQLILTYNTNLTCNKLMCLFITILDGHTDSRTWRNHRNKWLECEPVTHWDIYGNVIIILSKKDTIQGIIRHQTFKIL